jgi:amino acid permease
MDLPKYSEKMGETKEDSGPTKELDMELDAKTENHSELPSELISAGSAHLHRRLGGKEIQLFAVGGAIGTCTHPRYLFPIPFLTGFLPPLAKYLHC